MVLAIAHAPSPPKSNPRFPTLGGDNPEGVTLGRLLDPKHGPANKLRYVGERHLLLFGPNGTGKGTRILMPNLLQMAGNRSIVVVDTKGELAAVTAPFRRQLGRVVVLNPFGVLTDWPGYADLQSAGFNPLVRLDPASRSFNSDAAALADALIYFDPTNAHWDGSAQALLAALIMYVVIEARDAREVPTIARVRELLCMASGEGKPELDMPPYGLPALALEMMKSSIAGLRNKASQFTNWNKEIQGIASTAKRQTEALDDPEIADDMEPSGFDFADLRREPTTVYIVLPPDQMERHAKWLRLIISSALYACMHPRRANEPSVLFMLDEFFALGHMRIIETVWSLVRGYGIQMMPVLQDLHQLKKLYPDMWETFIGMAGPVMSFVPNDMSTAEWLSRRCGDTTRKLDTFNTSHSWNSAAVGASQNSGSSGFTFSQSQNSSPVKVPLITPYQLMGMQTGYMVGSLAGLSHCLPLYAPAYYQIRQCLERARANPYYSG